MRRGGVLWAVLSFGGAVACGGRYEKNAPTSDGVERPGSPASGSGGASGSAGMTSQNRGGGAMAVAGSAGITVQACVDQFLAYEEYRVQVVAEFSSFKCTTDDDCRSVYHQSSCDPSCVLLTTAAHRGVIDRLNNFGTANCSAECSPPPWPMCPAAMPVRCVSGHCQ